MNAEVLKRAGVDYDRGVKRFAGRAQLYEKTLTKFLQDSTFSRICAAYEKDDRALLLAGVHEFKGLCGNIAFPALYETSNAMVQLLRSEAVSETALAALYTELSETYKTVYDAILVATEETPCI